MCERHSLILQFILPYDNIDFILMEKKARSLNTYTVFQKNLV